MNDIESTELLRQHLVERLEDPTVTPFVFLRRDRAGRTAAFVRYVNWLAANGLVGRVHAAGTHTGPFERTVRADVVHHDQERDAPADVLDACLADGHPVYAMGNTVAPFMRGLNDVIEARGVSEGGIG
jgi:hypothetical protein